MKLYEAITKLYDVLALDKNIAKEILKELVEDESVCFILSIRDTFSRATPMLIRRGGQNANIDYQLGQLLHNLGSSNKVFNSYFKTLDMKTQVVLKEVLQSNSKYDSTIFYGYAKKTFSKREILEYLQTTQPTDEKLQYFTSDSPKYYYKTRESRIIYNTLPKGFKHLEPIAGGTILYDGYGNARAYGQREFGEYLKNYISLPDVTGTLLRTARNIAEIQYKINSMIGNRYAIVLHKEGIKVLTKESIKLTCGIIDFILSDDFEVIGVWVEYQDNVYEIKGHVPKTVIDTGIDSHTVTFNANELISGKLNNIEFRKFSLKEEDVNT